MKFTLLLFLVISSAFASSDFIYATGKNFEIYLNPQAHWNQYHNLADGYSASEREFIDPIIKEAGLCETQESTFEPCGFEWDDFFWALELLEEHGVKYDPDFQAFISKFE